MRLPNKLYTTEESLFSRFPLILSLLEERPMTAAELLVAARERANSPKKAKTVSDAGEMLDVLDCLYALRKIDFDEGRGVLVYVG